jgi:transposase
VNDKKKRRRRHQNRRKKGTINTFVSSRTWLQKCPSNTRTLAVYEAVANRKTCFTNLKLGHIKHFKEPYRSKKNERAHGWSLALEKKDIHVNRTDPAKAGLEIFKKELGEMRYFGSKQLAKLIPNSQPAHDCKIVKDRYGDWYLCVPVDVNIKTQVSNVKKAVTIDPGERKFGVSYSPTDGIYMYGVGASKTILQLCIKVDKLVSQISNNPQKHLEKIFGNMYIHNVHRLRVSKMIRLRKRIDNLKAEMRFKIANHLVKNNDLIMLPKLEVKQLISNDARKRLTAKVSRALSNCCHGKFFDHLKFKCLEQGKIFMEVPEDYTSKTCPYCGHLNTCDEIYHCKSCKFEHDRDAVGSANILLRAVR